MIKTKPIVSYRVDIYTDQTLCYWFETEYRPAIDTIGIYCRRFIYNIDKKKARVCIPAGEEIVILIRIKEMYTGIPENRLFVTIIEYISADRNTIPPVIIIPGVRIIASWFNDNMTRHELITVSESGYTNKGICMAWLDHFIKYYNCITDKNSD
jgi:hypothetical protein